MNELEFERKLRNLISETSSENTEDWEVVKDYLSGALQAFEENVMGRL